jgi:hypothetical protein
VPKISKDFSVPECGISSLQRAQEQPKSAPSGRPPTTSKQTSIKSSPSAPRLPQTCVCMLPRCQPGPQGSARCATARIRSRLQPRSTIRQRLRSRLRPYTAKCLLPCPTAVRPCLRHIALSPQPCSLTRPEHPPAAPQWNNIDLVGWCSPPPWAGTCHPMAARPPSLDLRLPGPRTPLENGVGEPHIALRG